MVKGLKIGDLNITKPIIQGGMGVGISLSHLAGKVASLGGIGLISTAQIGYKRPDFIKNPFKANIEAIKEELKKAREIVRQSKEKLQGAVGFNIMVATRGYEKYCEVAVAHGADIIVSGAGLPIDLPVYLKNGMEMRKEISTDKIYGERNRKTKIVPIVSSSKSANVILKMWHRKYNITADAIVIEGPLAGGHLGFSMDELEYYGAVEGSEYKRALYDQEIKNIIKIVREYEEKFSTHIPIILAGGIYTHQDFEHALHLGLDGVQVGTRFVTTKECDAPEFYKEAYIRAKKDDIKIVKSPVGLPGRAINNIFLEEIKNTKQKIGRCYQCLSKCDMTKIPYCITEALIKAVNGEIGKALLFAGANAYKADKIETVKDVINSICG